MEGTRTKTYKRKSNLNSNANFDSDSQRSRERLDQLLALNSEYARLEEVFRSDKEKFEAELIANPYTNEKAFSYFGLMLGAFPPAAFFAQLLIDSGGMRSEEAWFLVLFFLVNITSATVGFFSGRLIGKIVTELENLSWHWMLLALPFLGLLWGIISGGAGGFFLFGIGAIFGAMLGGLVGSIALPAFGIFHRIFKRGDVIDRKIFFPLAFGVTFIISAFILGF